MSAAFDISDDSRAPRFNKFAWKDQFRLRNREGTVDWKAAALVLEYISTCGTAAPESHIPLVWRLDDDLIEACGMSGPTYRRLRKDMAKAGLLFEIPRGKGSRQTIKVLKHPGWSEVEALRSAIAAFDAYCDANELARWGGIRQAVAQALSNRTKAATAKKGHSGEALEGPEPDPPQTKADFGANESSFRLPPYNAYVRDSVVETSSKHDASHAREASATAEHSKKTRSKATTNRCVVDFEHIKALRNQWIQLFAELGRRLDEGVALKLARVYRAVDDPDRLEHGTFSMPSGGRERLGERLVRLFGDGRSVGVVAKYLVEDASGWRPGPEQMSLRDLDEPRGDAQTPSRPAEESPDASDSSNFAAYFERVQALEADGLDTFEAYDAVDAEWREQGLELP